MVEITMKGSAVLITGTANEIADLVIKLQSVQKSEKKEQRSSDGARDISDIFWGSILDTFD